MPIKTIITSEGVGLAGRSSTETLGPIAGIKLLEGDGFAATDLLGSTETI